VIAASRSPESRRLAQEHGAQLAVPLGGEGAVESIRDFTGGDGAQCAFDMVGLAATMKAAAGYVGRGGQIIVIGEEPEFPPIDTIAIAQRELEIIGSRNGGLQDAADALTMLARGILRPPIDRRYALDELPAAMDYVRSGQTHGRIVVEIGS
jgi:propanol-preferring alcohol dehydrogenase